MNNFIFKSSKGLVKKLSNTPEGELILDKLNYVQLELRHQRSEHQDILRMINRLLVDKHLQMQVDEYFEDNQSEETPGVETDESMKV